MEPKVFVSLSKRTFKSKHLQIMISKALCFLLSYFKIIMFSQGGVEPTPFCTVDRHALPPECPLISISVVSTHYFKIIVLISFRSR